VSSPTEALARFVAETSRLFVITGAGCSAPSGIETYRDDLGEWHRPAPIQHQDFVNSEAARRRYWARSLRGWPMFAAAQANAAHRALVRLEATGPVECVLTQNVDGLHQQAGARRVIELHGSLATVVCLTCGGRSPREELQQRLMALNPQLLNVPSRAAPDGDADLGGAEDAQTTRVPECERCSGMLKPDVVFYGDSVPRARVEEAFAALERADGLLVVGSSLMVFSSFRFCRRARQLGLPMAAINQGRTRADEFFDVKVEADCAIVLPKLLAACGMT
jgi:NAD-dependent SIR2 family protein deacetylase